MKLQELIVVESALRRDPNPIIDLFSENYSYIEEHRHSPWEFYAGAPKIDDKTIILAGPFGSWRGFDLQVFSFDTLRLSPNGSLRIIIGRNYFDTYGVGLPPTNTRVALDHLV